MAFAGVRKAAIVLSSLPERQAAALLTQLTAAESEAVRGQMASLGQVGRRRRQVVLQEFAARATVRRPASGIRYESIEARASNPATTRFRFLRAMATEDLATLLAEEHPQTIALILSHLPADRAGQVLSAMPSELQASIIRRIATMDEPSTEVVDDLEEALRQRVGDAACGEASIGMVSIVKMLGAMQPATERQLLDDIAQADPNLFGTIRRAMFGADVASCEMACEAASN